MKTEKLIKRLMDAQDIVSSYAETIDGRTSDERDEIKAASKAEDAISKAIEMVEDYAKLEKKVKKLKKKNAKLKDEIEELKSFRVFDSKEDIEKEDDEEEYDEEEEEYEDDFDEL